MVRVAELVAEVVAELFVGLAVEAEDFHLLVLRPKPTVVLLWLEELFEELSQPPLDHVEELRGAGGDQHSVAVAEDDFLQQRLERDLLRVDL